MFDEQFFNELSSFADMIGTYEQRNIANFKNDVFEIDTSGVTDRALKYESAIRHKDFNDNEWIILGWADTKENAEIMHNKFVEYFLSNDVAEITDAYTNETFKKGD